LLSLQCVCMCVRVRVCKSVCVKGGGWVGFFLVQMDLDKGGAFATKWFK
jgi:hypothetical protein